MPLHKGVRKLCIGVSVCRMLTEHPSSREREDAVTLLNNDGASE